MPVFASVAWLITALSALFGTMAISAGNELMTVTIDKTVAIKLACSAMAIGLGALGCLFLPPVRRTLISFPGALLILIYTLAIVAGTSGVASNALPSAIIGLGYVAFTVTCLALLGIDGVASALLAGVTLYIGLAWFLFLAVPDIGVFQELLDDGFVFERMGGVNHPNGVGRTGAIGLLILVYFYRSKRITHLFLFLTLAAAFAGAVYLARSRTAIAGCVLGIAALYLDHWLRPRTIMAVAIALMAGLVLVFGLLGMGKADGLEEKLVTMIAKTGNAEEITSGTGRNLIWARAIELIWQKPLQGHGFGSAVILMDDMLQSTHNMVLHVAMVSGLIGGLALVSLIAWMVCVCLPYPNRLVSASVVLILVCGLMEDTILETFPASTTLLWETTCLAPAMWITQRFARSSPSSSQTKPKPISPSHVVTLNAI